MTDLERIRVGARLAELPDELQRTLALVSELCTATAGGELLLKLERLQDASNSEVLAIAAAAVLEFSRRRARARRGH